MALDFALSEEQTLIRNTARDVVAPFAARRQEMQAMLARKEFPQDLWDALAEAGFFGCVVPEEYGGSGTGLLSMAFAVEALGSIGFGNAIVILTTMDALCLVRNGPEEVRRRFLPGIASGARKLCFAVTESNAGSNTFAIETLARREGDRYVVNGSKTYITGADVADHMLLVTRTTSLKECQEKGLPKEAGLTLLIVDTKSPGIVKHPLPTGAIEGLTQYTLFFEDLEVPAANVVGEEGQGTKALFKALNPERILAAASAVGVSEYCLGLATDYARVRKVFRGTPIGAYQGIQHPLADVRIRQEAVRMLAYKAAWAQDRGLSPVEVGLYANCAKYLGAELGLAAVDAAIETLGGNGFSEEFGLGTLWERMRLVKTAPVSKEMILNFVAEHTLGLPRSY